MKIKRGPDPGPHSRHGLYKPALQPLFMYRCAYCQTLDTYLGGIDGMTVDHFLCEARYPHLKLAWSNLYYSCGICNSHYKKDRPTEDEEKQGLRFVDPCEKDVDDHFRLALDPVLGFRCMVKPLTPEAKFVVFVLKLNDRKSIRDYWRDIEEREQERAIQLQQLEIVIADARTAIEKDKNSQELKNIWV
jgi:hypothetical protein